MNNHIGLINPVNDNGSDTGSCTTELQRPGILNEDIICRGPVPVINLIRFSYRRGTRTVSPDTRDPGSDPGMRVYIHPADPVYPGPATPSGTGRGGRDVRSGNLRLDAALPDILGRSALVDRI